VHPYYFNSLKPSKFWTKEIIDRYLKDRNSTDCDYGTEIRNACREMKTVDNLIELLKDIFNNIQDRIDL